MSRYRGQKVRYRRRGVVRLQLRQLLETRAVSPYGLAKFTGLSLNTIYRLTRPSGRFELIRADTIERLCGALPPEVDLDHHVALVARHPPAPGRPRLAPRGRERRGDHGRGRIAHRRELGAGGAAL